MALSILNNISALTAQNQLSLTQAGLNKALTQLSSGSKINSGADDAAGLSLANGLQANIAALTQSAQNATNGVGLLQTADGAYSQVTTLLNRAVTLATEASNGGLTGAQATAIETEYTSIQNEIDKIGSTTNFNGSNIFGGQDMTTWTGTSSTVAGGGYSGEPAAKSRFMTARRVAPSFTPSTVRRRSPTSIPLSLLRPPAARCRPASLAASLPVRK